MDVGPMEDEAPVAAEPSKEDLAMAHVDAALAPAHRLAEDLGPVNHGTLAAVLASIRQAFAHLVYGPPEPSEHDGESLDMLGEQRKAQRVANTPPTEAELEADPNARFVEAPGGQPVLEDPALEPHPPPPPAPVAEVQHGPGTSPAIDPQDPNYAPFS